jgi:hypothetical protein
MARSGSTTIEGWRVKMNVLWCSLAAVLVVGCGFDAEEVATSDQALIDPECSIWGCAANASSMSHELDGSGQFENDIGLKLVSFKMDAIDLTVDVRGDVLRGIGPDGTVYGPTELLTHGATFQVDYRGQGFLIRYVALGQTPYWALPATIVPTYTFQYSRADAINWKDLCDGRGATGDSDWASVDKRIALVFIGDRYDTQHKTVSSADVGRWFNIACAGTAVAKMHLLRHTTAGSDATHSTTDSERTAMLKMITDDICGTGQSFTRDGENVRFMDRKNFRSFDLPRTRSIESVWSDHGAICLTEARRAKEEPEIVAAIQAACGWRLPACTMNPQIWYRYGYGISANPW